MGRVTASQAARFIPAGAGNTGAKLPKLLNNTVYPRWRGEHPRKPTLEADTVGLSPLARGTPELLGSLIIAGRFIPAGAGNTPDRPGRIFGSPVYPRWRGEHFYQNVIITDCGGLSPLARGTQLCQQPIRQCDRFIPAGAGNTPKYDNTNAVDAVYPRWRGEHIVA